MKPTVAACIIVCNIVVIACAAVIWERQPTREAIEGFCAARVERERSAASADGYAEGLAVGRGEATPLPGRLMPNFGQGRKRWCGSPMAAGTMDEFCKAVGAVRATCDSCACWCEWAG